MWLAMGFVIGFIEANFGDVTGGLLLLLAAVPVTVILYMVVEITVYLQVRKRPTNEIDLTIARTSPSSSMHEGLP